MKYSLGTREIRRAEPMGFPEGSCYISPYIPYLTVFTRVIIQTFSIYQSYTSSVVFPGRANWKSWFSLLVWLLRLYFPVFPSIWSNTVPYIPNRELYCGSTRKYTWSGEKYYLYNTILSFLVIENVVYWCKLVSSVLCNPPAYIGGCEARQQYCW